jgi:hypothetical protein
MLFIITATMVVVGAFILGWLKGYKKILTGARLERP